jgi:TonB family protein
MVTPSSPRTIRVKDSPIAAEGIMHGRLLESGHRRTRTTRETVGSLVVHALIIALAVRATDAAARPSPSAPAVVSVVVPPAPAPASPRPPRPVSQGASAPIALHVPTTVPTTLPPPDAALGALLDSIASPTVAIGQGTLTDPRDLGSGTVAQGPTEFAPGDSIDDRLQPASLAQGSATPRYPDPLRSSGRDGRVEIEFIIDTLGRAEVASVAVRHSDDAAFTQAVMSALPRMRFVAARRGDGARVRQRVAQVFEFSLQR